MAMPAPASDPRPYYPSNPPRRGNGCLWGCLGIILLLFLPVILAGAYGTWFLYDGYRHDPVLRVVSELVRRDGTTHQVLGDPVVITGVDGNVFSWTSGIGGSSSAIVALRGPKGEGHLAVTSHSTANGPSLDSAILTGPDGARYDLLQHRMLDAPDNSI